MVKNYILFLSFILFFKLGNAQITSLPLKIIDDMPRHTSFILDNNQTKRSNVNPKTCVVDTVEFPRQRGSAYFTVNVSGGRSLGQLYDCPSPITLSGFTFYAFVAANPPSPKTMRMICNVYNASADSLPTGSPLRSDTITIDSTFGGGLLSRIEKHCSFAPITLTGKYILTVETDSTTMNAGVVTNSYTAGNGRRNNLNCGSINGFWYNGKNLNVGGVPFDCDILLHPHVKYIFGADFTINNQCYNLADSVKCTNASFNNVSGSKVYNRYEYFNLGYFCHQWNNGVNQFTNTNVVNYATKYAVKQDYQIRLISRIYGYRGPALFNPCIDTTIKTLYFRPDVPQAIGNPNVCIGDSAQIVASSSDTGIVYEWFRKPTSPSPFLVGSTYKIMQVLANDTVYLRARNKTCLSNFRTVIIRANKYPTTLSFKDDSICAGSRAILKATTDAGNILWFNNINDITPIHTGEIYQTPILMNDFKYYIEANNAGCKLLPRQEINIRVGADFAPNPPVVSNDTLVCLSNGTDVEVSATPGSGLSIRWFNTNSGGAPIGLNNTYVFSPTFRETKILYADAFNGVCGSSRVPVEISVEDYPLLNGVNQPTICKGDSAVVIANLSFGTVKWYNSESSNTELYDGTRFVSYPVANQDYYIETVSGACVNPTRTKMTVTVNKAPEITKVWADTICTKNPATFKAVVDGPGLIRWYEDATSDVVVGSGNTFKSSSLIGPQRYFVGTVNAGCFGPRSSAIPLVNASPFTGFSFEILTWQQVRLSPINAGSGAVKWHFGDGNTSTISTVTHRYEQVGTYDVKLVVTSIVNGCKDSTTLPVSIETSSLKTINLDRSISIYPNPTNHLLNVSGIINNDISNKIKIYKMNGMLVKEFAIDALSDLQVLNLSELSNGMYLIKLDGYKPVLFNKLD
jgi:hypothetical protein